MRFPVAIELGTEDTAYGVVVPDLPGCFSAADTLDGALAGAEEAVASWIEAALDDGQPIPRPSDLHSLRANPDFAGWTLAVVTVDPADLDDTAEHVELVLPRRVLRRLDARAQAAGVSRDGLVAELALGGVPAG